MVTVDAYERLQSAVDYDVSDPDPRDLYPAFAQAVGDSLKSDGAVGYGANDPQSWE